jgi:hypothetical protein
MDHSRTTHVNASCERKHVIELSERSTKGGTGPTAIEYGLIVAGISLTIIVGVG